MQLGDAEKASRRAFPSFYILWQRIEDKYFRFVKAERSRGAETFPRLFNPLGRETNVIFDR